MRIVVPRIRTGRGLFWKIQPPSLSAQGGILRPTMGQNISLEVYKVKEHPCAALASPLPPNGSDITGDDVEKMAAMMV
jgi:hypothetical protein